MIAESGLSIALDMLTGEKSVASFRLAGTAAFREPLQPEVAHPQSGPFLGQAKRQPTPINDRNDFNLLARNSSHGPQSNDQEYSSQVASLAAPSPSRSGIPTGLLTALLNPSK